MIDTYKCIFDHKHNPNYAYCFGLEMLKETLKSFNKMLGKDQQKGNQQQEFMDENMEIMGALGGKKFGGNYHFER